MSRISAYDLDQLIFSDQLNRSGCKVAECKFSSKKQEATSKVTGEERSAAFSGKVEKPNAATLKEAGVTEVRINSKGKGTHKGKSSLRDAINYVETDLQESVDYGDSVKTSVEMLESGKSESEIEEKLSGYGINAGTISRALSIARKIVEPESVESEAVELDS